MSMNRVRKLLVRLNPDRKVQLVSAMNILRGWLNTPEDPQIIRTVEELKSLDPDTLLGDTAGDVLHAGDYLIEENPRRALEIYRSDLPAVVIAPGEQVRAARKALEETDDG